MSAVSKENSLVLKPSFLIMTLCFPEVIRSLPFLYSLPSIKMVAEAGATTISISVVLVRKVTNPATAAKTNNTKREAAPMISFLFF